MNDIAISVDGLGKQYRLGGPSTGYATLRDRIRSWASPRRLLRRGHRSSKPSIFWALKDVSFDVHPGEVVGIIGRNGAGKSTLLKILSRITEPTEGGADIHGRVGSLLEVGTGFHHELTGRENIFLNGAILGMSRADITRQFDEIVAFAEVEQFVDTPVKQYSSGMYTRLAFAVAAHLEPEILVVDEVLAVGDAQFQKKCLGKMSDVARGGRTVLFVSHNMATVQNLCTRGILLDRGRVAKIGPTSAVVQAYLADAQSDNGRFNITGRRGAARNAEILDAWLEKDGNRAEVLLFGDEVDLVVRIQVRERVRFAVELILRQQDGLPVAFAPSGLAQGWEIDASSKEVLVRCHLPPARYAAGRYSIDLITAVSNVGFLDYVESGLTFTVDSAAIGDRNWAFSQSRGQGYTVWDVNFAIGGRVAKDSAHVAS